MYACGGAQVCRLERLVLGHPVQFSPVSRRSSSWFRFSERISSRSLPLDLLLELGIRNFWVPYVVGTHIVTGVIIESRSCPEKASSELRIEVKNAKVWLPLTADEEPITGKQPPGGVQNFFKVLICTGHGCKEREFVFASDMNDPEPLQLSTRPGCWCAEAISL